MHGENLEGHAADLAGLESDEHESDEECIHHSAEHEAGDVKLFASRSDVEDRSGY